MKLLFFKDYTFNYLLKAFILGIIAIFLTLSLVSYNAGDSSFNVASNNIIKNYMGQKGAYVSDLLLQIFGIGIGIFILNLWVWSITLILKKEIKFPKLKLISSFICINIICYLVNKLSPKLEFLSGIIGFLLNKWFGSYLNFYVYLALGAIFLLCFLFSIGLSWYEYLGVSRILFAFLNFIINIITSVFYIIFKVLFFPVTQSFKLKDNIFSKYFQNVRDKIGNTYVRDKIESIPSENKASREKNIVKKNKIEGLENVIFELPSLDLFNKHKASNTKYENKAQLEQNSNKLIEVLNDFGVKGNIIGNSQGPVVTLYEFEPSAGTKSSRVIGLSDDIARSISALSTRIAVMPGRNCLGIELPNNERETFYLKELLATDEYKFADMALPIVLGKDIGGKPIIVDLAKMPHLLVAGTTGSGKSVAINTMIVSLLYHHSPTDCKFIMIDPKMLELSVYEGIPHLLTPVVTEPGKAVIALKWAVKEMENRYRMMSNLGVRNIQGFNLRVSEALKKGEKLERSVQVGFDPDTGKPLYDTIPINMTKLPFIVVIVDEMADLMLVAGKDIEASVQRLAQMARAAGIHIIMATQRPSVDVITGVIKANFPCRISFKVTSKIDSRTILGEQGAEQLLGMGDMLYMGGNTRITRVHGPFVQDSEVENIVDYLKTQGEPEYITSVTEIIEENEEFEEGSDDDSLYRQAVNIVKQDKKASTSYVQRSLRIGYNRAAILIERMEKEGIISPPNHSGKREILIE